MAWSLALLLGATVWPASGGSCDDKLIAALQACERIVGSLRTDKAGQGRLFAPDGTEFTADQAAWLRDQLSAIVEECGGGDSSDAERRLAEVQQLLRRGSQPR